MFRKPTRTEIRIALIIAVCVAQFWVSARDIIAVALPIVHGDLSRAIAFPACIDLMILVSTLTVAAPKGVSKKARRWALAGRYLGFAFTIYANGLAGGIAHVQRIDAAIICNTVFMVAPALALICTMELAIHGAQGTPASRRARTAQSAAGNVTQLRRATA